jgi:hypothetical protein
MRTRLAVCTVLLLGCLAAPASAQQVPEDAAVVAEEPGRWKLHAFDRRGRLCHAFVSAQDVGPIADCERYRRLTAVDSELWSEYAFERAFVAGVVAPDVIAVEAELRDGRRVRADTTAGPAYQGAYAGRVRFAVLELPVRTGAVDDSVRIVRFLAADGRTIGAQADFHSGPYHFDARRVARGGRPGARWELRADWHERLVPTPLALDRLERRGCVWVQQARDERSTSRTCFAPGEPDQPLRLAWRAGCDAAGTRIVILAAPGVRDVRAVLGDGRRREVRLRSLPRAFAGRRAGVVSVGAGVAVRRIVAEGVPPLPIAMPPATADCEAGGGTNDEPFVSGAFGDPARRGTAVTVRDEGTRLCLALGALRPFRDCLPAPVQASASRFISRREGGRTTLLGAVTADVAAVEFQSRSGPVRVEPVDVGYTGRYREQLRFVHVELPSATRLWDPRLLAADGSRIASAVGPDARFALRPRTVARGAGGLRLVVGVLALGGDRIPCYVVTSGPPSARDRDTCAPHFFLLAEVHCTPRRIVISSILPRAARAVDVRLASGRVVRVPSVRVSRLGRAFIAVLPRDAAPRSLQIRGAGESVPLRLPPASEQCGYRSLLL